MRLIPLHGSYAKQENKPYAKVSDEDYERVAVRRWRIGSGGYAVCSGYAEDNVRNMLMHVFIMGRKDGLVIHHIDGDTLNNQRKNLRHVTHSVNVHASRSNPMRYGPQHRGVTSGRDGFWAVFHGERIGKFPSQEEAALAYNEAAQKCYGDLALLNTVSPS